MPADMTMGINELSAECVANMSDSADLRDDLELHNSHISELHRMTGRFTLSDNAHKQNTDRTTMYCTCIPTWHNVYTCTGMFLAFADTRLSSFGDHSVNQLSLFLLSSTKLKQRIRFFP